MAACDENGEQLPDLQSMSGVKTELLAAVDGETWIEFGEQLRGSRTIRPDQLAELKTPADIEYFSYYADWRRLPDGRLIAVQRELGQAKLCIVNRLFRASFDDSYDFPTVEAAIAALHAYQEGVEPAGWHRHMATGRRRPDGDASREYVAD